MKPDYISFIQENSYIFTHPTQVDQMTRDYIYRMYNETFNENRRPNGCGRCWATVKTKLYQTYLKETL